MGTKNRISRCEAKATTTGSSLTLYGDIGMDWFGDGITADQVREMLDRCSGDLAVYINSAGGSVFEGLAIYNQLKRYPRGKVTCYVDGLAASIASVIALAGTRLEMSPASLLMIHEAQAVVLGNAAAMRKCADDLDKITETIRSVYVAKTGMPDKKCAEMMAAETWLTAKECLEQGFADAVIEQEPDDPDGPDPEELEARLVDTYQNTPSALRQVPRATAVAQMQMALQRMNLRRSPMTSGAPRPAGSNTNRK